MLRNYLIAALRNLARNKLYAAINIVGLAAGFTAAILIALFVRDELSYDRFWPDYKRVYMVSTTIRLQDMPPWRMDAAPAGPTALWKQRMPAGVTDARLVLEQHAVRHGNVEANESIGWVDPQFFSVLRLPALAGNLDTALQQPDGVVLSQRVARKYFGDSNPIDQTIELDRVHPMRVGAVVQDIPGNSHLELDFFASGRAAFSALAAVDTAAASGNTSALSGDFAAYVRMPADVSV